MFLYAKVINYKKNQRLEFKHENMPKNFIYNIYILNIFHLVSIGHSDKNTLQTQNSSRQHSFIECPIISGNTHL